MPVSVCVTIEAVRDADLPGFLGTAAHAAFLGIVSRMDAALGSRLHDEEGAKGYTVSGLWGPRPERSRVKVTAGQHYLLRFTSYEDTLSSLLSGLRPGNQLSSIMLTDAEFRVIAVDTDPAANPWARAESFEEIASRHLFGAQPGAKVVLQFVSPTCFRSRGATVPFPLPVLVFGSLLERWNAFAPAELSPDFRRFAEECVVASKYELRTEIVPVAGARQVGFTGTCEFTAINRDAYWLRLMNLLADFAFYSGVGYKTGMGLGQCRVSISKAQG